MEWIYLILLILISIAGFIIGFRYVGPMKSNWWILIASLSIGLIILYNIFRFYPALEYHTIPLFLGPLTEVVSFIPFATLFFGIAAKRVKSRYLPIEATISALLAFGYGLMRVNWIYMDHRVDPAKFLVNQDDICIQTTGYTCGPASAVTLLKHWGVNTTEFEMARLTHTRYGVGVEMVPLTRALAQKLKDEELEVDIITADWLMLKKLSLPCIVNVKWTFWIDHMIVILKVEEDKVTIADPLKGETTWTKQKFLSKWRGSAIIIKPNRKKETGAIPVASRNAPNSQTL